MTANTGSASSPGFSFSTIGDFDTHIACEIRGYDTLFAILLGLADAVVVSDTNVYDLGCSTGRLVKTLGRKLAEETDRSRRRHVRFIGIEPNENFAQHHADAPPCVSFIHDRVTETTRFVNASLITSIFTLQFIPVHQRMAIVANIYRGLNPGGVFILAEKVYSNDVEIDRLINDRHVDFKREITRPSQILEKDARLRSIMRPMTLSENIQLLARAGFERYDSFWRINNFVALIAIKSAVAVERAR